MDALHDQQQRHRLHARRAPGAGPARLGARLRKALASGFPDRVTPELAAFIAELDTAFLATVSAAGAPYIQHRGGPKGFIKVLDDKTLGFADYAGNRQYITISNLAGNDRAYLFLLDFAAAAADQDLGTRAGGRGRSGVARAARGRRLPRPPGARDPVHARGVGRELLPAHHRALHRGRGSGGHAPAARTHRRARSRERALARRHSAVGSRSRNRSTRGMA